MVASGFLLRAIAGGVATGIPLSQWFLLVAAFGSFFMVAGKRYSELKSLGSECGHPRVADPLLRVLPALRLDAGRGDGAHLLQPVGLREPRSRGTLGVPWTAISIAPFTLGLLQYALEVDAGTRRRARGGRAARSCAAGIGLVWLADDLARGVLLSEQPVRDERPRATCPHQARRRRRSSRLVPQQLVELHGWGRAAGTRSHLAQIDSVADAVSALRSVRRPARRGPPWARPQLRRRRPERRRHDPRPDQAEPHPVRGRASPSRRP